VVVLDKKRAREYAANISLPTLNRSLEEGLPHFKVGRRVFIAQSALDKWLKAHERVGVAKHGGTSKN
jgi:hypothetical protein